MTLGSLDPFTCSDQIASVYHHYIIIIFDTRSPCVALDSLELAL